MGQEYRKRNHQEGMEATRLALGKFRALPDDERMEIRGGGLEKSWRSHQRRGRLFAQGRREHKPSS